MNPTKPIPGQQYLVGDRYAAHCNYKQAVGKIVTVADFARGRLTDPNNAGGYLPSSYTSAELTIAWEDLLPLDNQQASSLLKP